MSDNGRSPSVAWNPQPMDALKARYRESIKDLVIPEEIVSGRRKPPSAFPQHVFDTEDGLRLIVSRERLPGVMQSVIVIHISASINLAEKMMKAIHASGFDPFTWTVKVWQEISGERREPEFIGVSDGGIPHWTIEVGH